MLPSIWSDVQFIHTIDIDTQKQPISVLVFFKLKYIVLIIGSSTLELNKTHFMHTYIVRDLDYLEKQKWQKSPEHYLPEF